MTSSPALSIVAIAVAVMIALIVAALPVKWAAAAMGAKRTGVFWCWLALIGASILHALGLLVPVLGTLVAFLLAAAGFAAILGTTYLRGIGIAVLHVIFAVILLTVIALAFGLTLAQTLHL